MTVITKCQLSPLHTVFFQPMTAGWFNTLLSSNFAVPFTKATLLVHILLPSVIF